MADRALPGSERFYRTMLARPARRRDAAIRRRRAGAVRRLFLIYTCVTILAIICLLPVLWMVKTSFESQGFVRSGHIQLWPLKPTLQNYRDVLNNPNAAVFRSMLNSIIVASAATVVSLAVTAAAGYALSRFDFRGKLVVGAYFLLFYMIPKTLLLIGMFVMLARLHLINQLMGLVVAYAALGIPLAAWWLKGFFDSIPVEIEEQALTDGCSRLGALRRVIAPLARPGIAAVGAYLFIDSWNEYMMALTVIQTADRRLLPVQIVNFIGIGHVEWGQVMAFSVIVAMPAVILFAFAQRQMVRGLMSGFSN
jgi:ABC-type glycerol-3-phosphate transport system permease component